MVASRLNRRIDTCFVVIGAPDRKVAYIYFADEPGRRSVAKLALERPAAARHQGGARGHARQHGLGRAGRKHLDGQQGRLGEDRPGTRQFPETGGGPDTVVRRLDPAQSGLKNIALVKRQEQELVLPGE
jgi:hypothetical protein